MTITARSAQTEATAPSGVGRWLWPTAASAAVAAALGGWALITSGSPQAPYADTTATGRITLCDPNGSAVTTGSILDAPFAARLVGSSAAGLAAEGSSTLPSAGGVSVLAAQPREGVPPNQWTSLQLGVTTPVEADHLAVAALSPASTTLAQFIAGYPATWDATVQLRLLVSTSDGNAPAYDSVDLSIDGQTWTAIDPGDPALC